VDALQAAGAGRQEEHVAAAEQSLGAVGVDDGARVDLGGEAEAHARGHVGLDEAGDDVDRGPLRGEDEMDADGAGHLREAGDGFFDVGAVEHHQVGELVDDDDDVGQRLLVDVVEERGHACRRACCTGRCCGRARLASSLRRRSISRTALRSALAASLGSVMMGVSRCGMPSYMPSSTRLGSTRIMRTCSGVVLEEHAHDHGVDGHGFAGAGEPAMSTCGMVARSAVTMRPLMSLPMAMARRLWRGRTIRTRHVAQPDGFASWLGTWMPTVDLPGMRSMRMDSARHGEAEVVGEAGDARVFDAGFGAELEGGDHGAGVDLHHLAVDAELGALLDQGAGFFAQSLFADDGLCSSER
jgi:hypothetical protein